MSKLSVNIGKTGENIAQKYLLSKGYCILSLNYHSRFGEIDIIACDEKYIIFAEVKTRNKETIDEGLQAIDTIKQNKIIKTALIYLSEHQTALQPRFDAIEVLIDRKKSYVRHIKSAFVVEGEYEIF